MAEVNINLKCDLQHAVKVQYLDGNLFSQDAAANTINIEVTDGGAPAEIGGTVSANVIRPDGGTVAVTGGTISGNIVSITLPAACYALVGMITIVVKLTDESTVTTLAAAVAYVYQSSTDTVVDPGTVVSSIQDLIDAIDTAVASIPADYSSLWTSLAPAFSSSTAYTAGQYVTYNGGLYRFTKAHAAGSWASGDVVAVNLGGEISDVKSAINELEESILGIEYENMFDTTTYHGSNSAVSYDGDGVYTIGTTDFGVTLFGSPVTLPPGIYSLYGVPCGTANIVLTSDNTQVIAQNSASYPITVTIATEISCQLRFSITNAGRPTTAKKITPYFSAITTKYDEQIVNVNKQIYQNNEIILGEYYPQSFTDGGYINYTDGTVGSLGTESYSDYIKIGAGDKLYLKNQDTPYTADLRGLAFYNKDKTYISGVQYTTFDGFTATAPENTRYVRITVRKTIKDSGDFIYAQSFSNYIDDVVEEAKETEIEITIGDLISGKYINSSTGEASSLNNMYCTDFIPVTPGVLYKIHSRFADAAGGAFYGSRKQYISGIPSGTGGEKDYTATAPAQAKYIRFSVYTSSVTPSLKAIIDLEYCYNALSDLSGIDPVYTDVSMFDNMGVCGDSYTKSQFYNAQGTCIGDNEIISWGKILGRMKGINVSVYASSGADTNTWQQRSDCLPALLADTAKRLYVFNLCINDYTYVTLGTLDDITDHEEAGDYPNTYYGNWGNIISQVQEHAPNAKIILMKCWLPNTPYYNYGATAIEEICDHYGIAYIDPAQNAFFTSSVFATKQGGHPTPIQQSGMAKAVAELISKCMQENPAYFNDYFPQ